MNMIGITLFKYTDA